MGTQHGTAPVYGSCRPGDREGNEPAAQDPGCEAGRCGNQRHWYNQRGFLGVSYGLSLRMNGLLMRITFHQTLVVCLG